MPEKENVSMRKIGINKALNEIINEQKKFKPRSNKLTMGTEISDSGNLYSADISKIKVLSGLNILADSLIKLIIEKSVFAKSDIFIEQRVSPDLQSELYKAGVENISFFTRLTVIENLPNFYEDINYQIHYMFNAVQNSELYSKLFPETVEKSCGILFPFHREAENDITRFFYLIEYVNSGKFLRISLESEQDTRLYMNRIPHYVVEHIDLVHAKIDISKVALNVTQGITVACVNQKTNFYADSKGYDDYIKFLNTAGFSDLEIISFSWDSQFSKKILSQTKNYLYAHIIHILYNLGDSLLVNKILHKDIIRLDDNDFNCYIDISQKDRCLNISFMKQRSKIELSDYLEKMPKVSQTAENNPEILKNINTLLIHHLTSEVLGFIQSLINMGTINIETLWVKYAGEIEPEYREIILSLPEHIFRFYSLTPVPEENGIQNRFILSDEFSPSEYFKPLNTILHNNKYYFFGAMQLTAAHLFFNMALYCYKNKTLFNVIEDGGYISPEINRLCLENYDVKKSAEFFKYPVTEFQKDDLSKSFEEWLKPVYIGSIEHTKNGYDALNKVFSKYGKLAFPSLTIAVSNYKVNNESRDVVYSCLNAVENIMNSMGFIFSERTALVLGAQGALGRKAMKILESRIGSDNLYGVDLIKPETKINWCYAPDIMSLPEKYLKSIDLIFGVTGISVCNEKWLEKLIFKTEKENIFFASGSTKTAEFTHLSDWLSKISQNINLKIRGHNVKISFSEIHDKKTGAYQGRTAALSFAEKTIKLHLLADIMPVNFLYYGVPAETMNNVMYELLKMNIALIKNHKNNKPLPSELIALDHDISIDGILSDK